MNEKSLVIYGIGPLAKLLHYYICNDSNYKVAAFCVDLKYKNADSFMGVPVICYEEVDILYPPEGFDMIIAFGYSKMRMRKVIFDRIKSKGYNLINYIHSTVIKNNVEMGENNIILAGCVIEPNVRIGDNNIIWSMSLLGHDSVIGNHNYISAKCLVSGDSTICDLCFIGNGTTMINGLYIDNETCLGAATYIRKNTKQKGVYAGNPARIIKFNHDGIELK